MTLPTEVRLRLKSYRLSGDITPGLQELDGILANEVDPKDRDHMFWQGITDLKAASVAQRYFETLPQPQTIHERISYAKFLTAMGDIRIAHDIMPFRTRLGPKAHALAERIAKQYRILLHHGLQNLAEVPAKLFEVARRDVPKRHDGSVLLYTGQLGPGGAERQFVEIAKALSVDEDFGPVRVAVRHTDPARNGDFHLRALQAAGLDPFVVDQNQMPVQPCVPSDQADLLDCLPAELSRSVATLAHYLRAKSVSQVYLWQDGGVLVGALASALAGVTRIVTSFRGLPPNLRPKLFKPDYEPLYQVMSADADITLTTNNQACAHAYQDWLALPCDTLKIVRNAVAKPSVAPSKTAIKTLQQITSQSGTCTKTILGVFRCDPVKQPDLWFRSAMHLVDQYPNLRFIHIGGGELAKPLECKLAERPYSDRIFRVGVSDCVGFWMTQADLFLHTARHEGSPNAIIEAQLAAIPVIATPAGGTVEEIQHGETGLLLLSSQPKISDIADAVRTLLHDREQTERLVQNAHKSAETLHHPKTVLRQTKSLFVQTRKVAAA